MFFFFFTLKYDLMFLQVFTICCLFSCCNEIVMICQIICVYTTLNLEHSFPLCECVVCNLTQCFGI